MNTSDKARGATEHVIMLDEKTSFSNRERFFCCYPKPDAHEGAPCELENFRAHKRVCNGVHCVFMKNGAFYFDEVCDF